LPRPCTSVVGVNSRAQAVSAFSGQRELQPVVASMDELYARLNTYNIDCSDVRG
jgi:hypothetical protein